MLSTAWALGLFDLTTICYYGLRLVRLPLCFQCQQVVPSLAFGDRSYELNLACLPLRPPPQLASASAYDLY